MRNYATFLLRRKMRFKANAHNGSGILNGQSPYPDVSAYADYAVKEKPPLL